MCVLRRVYTNEQMTTALAEHENTFYIAKIDFKFPLFFSFFRIPKAGLYATEWERRLRLVAQGKFELEDLEEDMLLHQVQFGRRRKGILCNALWGRQKLICLGTRLNALVATAQKE